MPKAAAELNAAEKILPLNKIADALIEMTNSNINSATTV
jgi:chemotaxis response regulator CheB